jgi:hypothetical protein
MGEGEGDGRGGVVGVPKLGKIVPVCSGLRGKVEYTGLLGALEGVPAGMPFARMAVGELEGCLA